MDSSLLKYFITVAEYAHLTKASEALNISQPALSQSIARMENELGINLFDRVGRNIILNEAGKAYVPYAKDVLKKLDEGQAVISNMVTHMNEHVTIQTTPLILFPGLLDSILSMNPTASINPTNVTKEALTENLILGKTDLCITHKLLTGKGINMKLLQSEQVVIVVSKDHPLLEKASVTIDDLTNQIFILGAQYNGLSNTFQSIFKDTSVIPKIGYYVNNFNEIFDYVKTGKCIAATVLPAYHDLVRCNQPNQINAIPIEGNIGTINNYLFWYQHNKNECMHKMKKLIIEYFNDAEIND